MSRDKYGQAVGRVQRDRPDPGLAAAAARAHRRRVARRPPSGLGPLREVRVALTRADTPSGLKWTQGSGPPGGLPIGVQAVSSVTIDRQTLLGKAFG